MKILITFFILSTSFYISAQKTINAENYYSFYKDYDYYKKHNLKKLSTSRLSELEMAKILYDEMKSAGFEALNNYRIIHLDNDNYILSICYSEKSNFGFVFEGIFDMIPDKANREVKSLSRKYDGYDHGEKIMNTDGKSRFLKVAEMPQNFFIIKQDIYWYQTTDDKETNKTLVTKDIIISIFKEDIRKVLNSVLTN